MMELIWVLQLSELSMLFFIVVPPYVIGFVLFGFLWHWRLLFWATVVAVLVAVLQYQDISRANGAGVFLGAAITLFLGLGAAAGITASFLVLLERQSSWRWLSSPAVLPVCFVVGLFSCILWAGI